MDMVAHQYIAMHRTLMTPGRINQKIQITNAVAVIKKNGTPVIASLDNMQRVSGNKDAPTASHA